MVNVAVDTETMLKTIIDAIKEKKGENISQIKFSNSTGNYWEYFLICSATNPIQARAISDNIELKLKEKHKIYADHIEGYTNAKWILLDYFDIIVHIFLPEVRDFYALEKLWADAQLTQIN